MLEKIVENQKEEHKKQKEELITKLLKAQQLVINVSQTQPIHAKK